MKRLILFLLVTALPTLADEKPLSDLDRELLLEKLQEIQESSDSTVKGRVGTALAAFKKARESDSAAHELYLNCIEKVRFEEQVRKASEFRDWKSRHKDRTDSPGFRLALRHQLNWLVLTLEAGQTPEANSKSTLCISSIESLLRDAEDLKGYAEILREKALTTIFAEAYSVKSADTANWPGSPLDIAEIYDQIVLPPLRTAETTEALRRGWLKRIEHEGLLLEKWTDEATADRDRKPAFEKWLNEGRKDLVWQMEVDLFRNGGHRTSSLKMLEHLKANLSHKSAPKWIAQFTRLVKGESVEEKAEGEKATAPTE